MNIYQASILIFALLLSSCSSQYKQSTSSESKPIEPPAAEIPISVPKPPQVVEKAELPTVIELRRYPTVTCDPSASRRREVRARHIPFEVPPFASETQWRSAYAKAQAAISNLQTGATFEQIEEEYGRNAASRGGEGGDLGFFKSGVMVPQFERMAFCLERGKLSPIFSSDFGFHILEVTNVRP